MKGKNNIIILVVVALIVGAGAFFAGMQYQQKTQSVAGVSGKMQVMGKNGMFQQRGGAPQGMTPVNGEIISQDDTSITVKLDDGSSKIIILSDKTTINKTSEGSTADLKTGEKVTAFGTTNPDGSITAQNVSLGGGMIRVMQQDGEKPTAQPAN